MEKKIIKNLQRKEFLTTFYYLFYAEYKDIVCRKKMTINEDVYNIDNKNCIIYRP